MRRIIRVELPAKTAQALAAKQLKADAKRAEGRLKVEAEWNSARRSKPLHTAFDILKQMAGETERCMYCGDSHGSDIEHFWPKTPYPQHMFRWSNMLLCCAECGRIKGNRFPLQDGQPALIDPTVDEPWQFLDFDPKTGNIVARYDPTTGLKLVKGIQTVTVLQLDRREALSERHRKTFRRIKNRIDAALSQPDIDAHTLITGLIEDDDHGLLGWCFDGTGAQVAPFAELRARYPAVWDACCQAHRQR